MPILDTRTNKDLIGTLISDIVLQLLSYVAQTERELIRQRQAEGIAIAKAQGKHLGRKPNPLPDQFELIYEQVQNRELTYKDAANKLSISYDQLRGIIYRYRKSQKNSSFLYNNESVDKSIRSLRCLAFSCGWIEIKL